MLKKTIVYTDYDGIERKEDHYFNLTQSELVEMEVGVTGGLQAKLKRIVDEHNPPEIMRTFKELISKSYGIKSADGKRFMKSEEISREFFETLAYDQLFMELCTDANKAADFVKAIMPQTNKPAMTAPAAR